MARYTFGGTGGDFVTDDDGSVLAGQSGTVWTARVGGVRVLDLLDADGAALDNLGVIKSDAHGAVLFQGPDDNHQTTDLWVDFGGGVRVAVKPTTGVPALLTTITSTTQTGTTYTLALADAGAVVEFTSSSAVTVTIPPHSSVAFDAGSIVELFQYGAGAVTIAAGSGVTIRSPFSSLTMAARYSTASLRQRAVDEWVVSGDLL